MTQIMNAIEETSIYIMIAQPSDAMELRSHHIYYLSLFLIGWISLR